MTISPSLDHIPDIEAQVHKPVVRVKKKKRSVIVWSAYFWLAMVLVLALTANFLPIADYAAPVGESRLSPSFGSIDLLLGTDSFGRSILSRCIYGARVSLVVGTVAGITGLAIGTTLGMIAGFFGRKVDSGISLLADAMLAFPPLILLLALSSILTPSVKTILVGLTLVTVPSFIRLARATTISWSSREFVRAAKNLGASNSRILLKEILPNVLPALGAFFPIVIAALIVAEGSLSFLGLGLPPPQPSWGGMISDGKSSIATSPHIVFVPSMVIFLTVFALNQVGDHLRLRFDRTMQD
ncbi:ABC transporter permease [Rhodococcus sp. SC4]|uniref:ABC transporter permease n=1 Tax=unclassified Rhodococcus (in: high G+C Gram-positive bacteria) TaxID=192944 RepID=UPI00076A573C|nr:MULTISPECIES: ABC transporter permease [unclassified Rhodococcus (in: high G+C Gram-positive bacteria)]KXF56050.1 ABC transporter permease [Rhodococcus sp. SC4]KXX58264.1 ABC transporter permease [Rhodococcus sp. LB1]PBC56412.1 ABC transporter permease [Rhodococcus sp. ACPA1]